MCFGILNLIRNSCEYLKNSSKKFIKDVLCFNLYFQFLESLGNRLHYLSLTKCWSFVENKFNKYLRLHVSLPISLYTHICMYTACIYREILFLTHQHKERYVYLPLTNCNKNSKLQTHKLSIVI